MIEKALMPLPIVLYRSKKQVPRHHSTTNIRQIPMRHVNRTPPITSPHLSIKIDSGNWKLRGGLLSNWDRSIEIQSNVSRACTFR